MKTARTPRPSSGMLEPLEARALFSAPVVTGGHVDGGSRDNLVLGRPGLLVADVVDDQTIRAVTFFQDRDGNGVWNRGVDLDLGAYVPPSPAPSGQFGITINPDPGWGLDPFVRVFAAAQDNEGAWSVPHLVDSFAVFTAPIIREFRSSVRSQMTENGTYYTTTLTAFPELPYFGGAAYVAGVTFFVDRD